MFVFNKATLAQAQLAHVAANRPRGMACCAFCAQHETEDCANCSYLF